MSAMSQGRRVIEVLERSYRDAEDPEHRPERVSVGVPEPTAVDARAAQQASADLLTLGLISGTWEDWLRISWFPYLRQFPGLDRSIGKGWEINDRIARFPIDGDVGRVGLACLRLRRCGTGRTRLHGGGDQGGDAGEGDGGGAAVREGALRGVGGASARGIASQH